MVALRVIVHTPYERVALAIPSTLYPSEATFFVQFLLQQHHSLDPIDTDTPQYVDVVSSSPWQLAHLTNGVLKLSLITAYAMAMFSFLNGTWRLNQLPTPPSQTAPTHWTTKNALTNFNNPAAD